MDDIMRKEMEESLAAMAKICGGTPSIRIILTVDGPEVSTNIPDKQEVLGVIAATLFHYQTTAARPLTIN